MIKEIEPNQPSKDAENIHERHGLTHAHWADIINRLGEPQDEISQKLVDYGRKVVDGEFLDNGFHHRQYLGQRHWELVAHLYSNYQNVLLPRKAFLWRKAVYPNMGNELADYALFERNATYTLNDYIAPFSKGISQDSPLTGGIPLYREWYSDISGRAIWDHAQRMWKAYEVRHTRYRSGGVYYWGDGSEEPPQEERWDIKLSVVTDQAILQAYLLSLVDVRKPLRASPNELEKTLFEKAASQPQKMRQLFVAISDEAGTKWNQIELNKWKDVSIEVLDHPSPSLSLAKQLQQDYQWHFGMKPYIAGVFDNYKSHYHALAVGSMVPNYWTPVLKGDIAHELDLPELSTPLVEKEVNG